MHRKTELCTERLSYAPKDRFLEHNSCLKNITRRLEHNSIIACSDCINVSEGYIPNLGPLGPLLHVEKFVVGGGGWWCVKQF